MGIYRAVAQLWPNSALPRDVVENVTHWSNPGTPTGTDFDQLGDVIADFYNISHGPQINQIYKYLSHDRDYTSGGCKVVFYTIPSVAGPVGSPTHIRNWTLNSSIGTGIPLPEQDAVCNSFHGNLSGVITHPGRHRGRFFVGPLNSTALEETATGTAPQTVNSDFMGDIIASWRGVLAAATGLGWTQVVFSRADWLGYPVTGGFVDDRFDTQRRRLERSSGRLTW